MIPARILVIDDNIQILESLRILLKDEFQDIDVLTKPSRLSEMLWRNSYDVILLDMNFAPGETTGNEGLFWLSEIRKLDPQLPVILITAYADIELAVKGIQQGAIDFISKPWDPEKLIVTLKNTCRLRKSGLEVRKLRNREKQLSKDLDREFQMFPAHSGIMNVLMDTLSRVAPTDANVLILGENGTGKEVLAREIHRRSNRSEKVFMGVDLGSLSETLFESEMFGHVKGAFTDAREDRAGRFENAQGGTLFLDEIGNLPLASQAKLLQVIQNRELVRVGDHRTIKFDIRLITATNMKLAQMVSQGRFREDLYYRLNTISVEIPPLRERPEDILPLANHFLDIYARKYQKIGQKLNREAKRAIEEYSWPGNIRELKHTMERAVILSDSQQLGVTNLRLFENRESPINHSLKLEDVERDTIVRVMKKCRGNNSRAAQMLDISRTTLYAKLKKYGI